MTVSVVMPTYNARPFLRDAIASVLGQTWTDFELIIVDDGSTDDSLAVAQSFAETDPRVKVFGQPNAGTALALNRAIDLASSEWVFIMHSDDLMHPNRLERQLAFLEEHPELAVASSLVRHIDDSGRVIGRDNSFLFTHEEIEEKIRLNKLIGFNHPAVVLRKSVVQSIGGYRQEFWPAEDIDLWNRLAEQGHKILVQPETLLDYRIHGGSASISRAHLTRIKVRWLKDSMLRRRRNEPELTWDQFLSLRRKYPIKRRINEERVDFSQIFYKAAVGHFAKKQYLHTVGNAALAVLLRPWYISSEIISKSKWRVKGNTNQTESSF
ncbi:glycosyltransferase family 2 protein [Tunturiibacter gelidoferens]|jgi:glycosyltransferase involved in cell wall biosynthesis|uniref:Glycosyltransferase involved in cell wall biosynthesis n=1 Tax=Tunturiibacter gelidiferens TaxID=3069689 RepID=A0A9X0U6Z6_9BACT|nr:glycosyltransferase [Edaphobacter lichenicola]MBB5331600.1 glycosyltransferase involved in cell wall biosynthesis [Edaphobacter lichenicola]